MVDGMSTLADAKAAREAAKARGDRAEYLRLAAIEIGHLATALFEADEVKRAAEVEYAVMDLIADLLDLDR